MHFKVILVSKCGSHLLGIHPCVGLCDLRGRSERSCEQRWCCCPCFKSLLQAAFIIVLFFFWLPMNTPRTAVVLDFVDSPERGDAYSCFFKNQLFFNNLHCVRCVRIYIYTLQLPLTTSLIELSVTVRLASTPPLYIYSLRKSPRFSRPAVVSHTVPFEYFHLQYMRVCVYICIRLFVCLPFKGSSFHLARYPRSLGPSDLKPKKEGNPLRVCVEIFFWL